MHVTCKLSTLMGRERLSIQDVHNRTGLSRTTLANLYHDRASRVDYETLSKLCALFGCQVGDVLQFGIDDSEETREIKER